jgi:hypothetical protein
MITITGLTAKQKAMMDIMWTMDSLDNVHAFVRTLPKRDAMDCLSLVVIATQETLEEEGRLDEYKDLALSTINSARYS